MQAVPIRASATKALPKPEEASDSGLRAESRNPYDIVYSGCYSLKHRSQKIAPQTEGDSRMNDELIGVLVAGGLFAFGWVLFVFVF